MRHAGCGVLLVLLAALGGDRAFAAKKENKPLWPPGRYMETNCQVLSGNEDIAQDPVVKEYVPLIGEGRVQIKVCDYTFERDESRTDKDKYPQTQHGWVVLANPPVETVERWIDDACRVKAPQAPGCAAFLRDYIAGQNGAQFPVLGFVSEGGPNDTLCRQYGRPVPLAGLISFQDGVTVQRAASTRADDRREGIYCATDGWGIEYQEKISRKHRITQTFEVARLAGLPVSCGRRFITGDIVRKANDPKLEWLLATRENHIQALRDNRDAMMEVQAERYGRGVRDLRGRCKADTPAQGAPRPEKGKQNTR